MEIPLSGEDYLEAVLILQKKNGWFVLLFLRIIWDSASRVSAMRWVSYYIFYGSREEKLYIRIFSFNNIVKMN